VMIPQAPYRPSCGRMPSMTRPTGSRPAGLTGPRIMSLSAHKIPATARVYVKRTEIQRMPAARKRRQFVERAT